MQRWGCNKRYFHDCTHIHTHTHTPGSSQTLSNKAKSATLPASSFAYDEGLPCLEKAKQRKEPIAVAYDSKVITDHAVSTRVPWMTWSWLLGYTVMVARVHGHGC